MDSVNHFGQRMSWVRCVPLVLLARLALVALAPPAAHSQCVDAGASDPGMVRIVVTLLSARAAASLDGDFEPFWTNAADLIPFVAINGVVGVGQEVDGDDTPHFLFPDGSGDSLRFTVEVPRNTGSVPIQIGMTDVDDPDPDDVVDLDPTPGDDVIDLSFDLCAYAFTGDGAGSDCENGVCRGGVDHQLGPGNRSDHASVVVRVETGDGLPVSDVAGDVAITGVGFVQIVDDPPVAVAGRGSILRVRMANTFPLHVDTTVIASIGDAVPPDATEEQPVGLDACQVVTRNFFVSSPVVVDISEVHFGAVIDPDGRITGTGAPQCVRFNNGSSAMGRLPIRMTRALNVVYQRIFHPIDEVTGGDLLDDDADAVAEAADADNRFRGFFPTADFSSLVDPIPLPIPFYDIVLGPRTEIQVLSELSAILGLDRVVGLLPQSWIDRHGYVLLPSGTTGVSNDKIAPHFVYAERIPGEMGFTPVHELGHTFGLSDEACTLVGLDLFQPWKCEDEYNLEAFPLRPAGGFRGRGFDVPNGVEAEGTCFMDNDDDAWISNNDFESFVERMTPGRDPRVLVVSGHVTAAGGGALSAAIGRPEGTPDRFARGVSPFTLVVRDAAGASLGEFGIFDGILGGMQNEDVAGVNEVAGDADGNGIPDQFPLPEPSGGKDRADFSLRIPWPAGGMSVALVKPNGAVIDSMLVDARARAIDLLEPFGEVRLEPGDLLPVRWRFLAAATGSGAAAPMGVAIASSYDGGRMWMPRAHRVQGNAFVIDARDLAAPVNVRIQVLALQNGMAGTDTVTDDTDRDRCPDPLDPSPSIPNTVDTDGDGIPDVCDRCPRVPDHLQTDADQDGIGDACDVDYNNDGRVDAADFTVGFLPCIGANVIARPECFDKDRNRDGRVSPDDFCSGNSCAEVIVGSASGAPGQQVTFPVTLRVLYPQIGIAGTQNDIRFAALASIARKANGRPDCMVNPAIDKGATSFAFQPPGCTVGVDCNAIRALVFATDNSNAIADGSVLYTCKVDIARSAAARAYPLATSEVHATDGASNPVAATGMDGAIQVVPACAGDCNGDRQVTIDEVVRGVNIALGTTAVDQCPSFDRNMDRAVTIDELVQAVNNALNGCA